MSFDDELSSNDLNSVAAGKRSDDRSYNVSKEQALAKAKELGGDIGNAYLEGYAKYQMDKTTSLCNKLKSDYEKWNTETE